MRSDGVYESEAQKHTIERLERVGGVQDERLDYIVWLLGRCIIVNEKGEVGEL